MHSAFAIMLAAVVTGQQPNILPELIPAPPEHESIGEGYYPPLAVESAPGPSFTQFAYPTGHPYPDVAPQGVYGPVHCTGWVYPNGYCGHHCVQDQSSWKNWWFAPGNMPLHYHYFAADHGYFYHAPYTVTRLGIQQAYAASYGGDPRHPYSTEAVDRAMAEFKKRHGEKADDDNAKPSPDNDLPSELPPFPPAEDGFDLRP